MEVLFLNGLIDKCNIICEVEPPTRPMNGPAAPIDIPDYATLPVVIPLPRFEPPRPYNRRLVTELETITTITQNSEETVQHSSVHLEFGR